VTQMVLVSKLEMVDGIGMFQGYNLDVDKYAPVLLDPLNNLFMNRDLAERDERYKQIIPYVVLRYVDSIFSYVRGKKSSETRLMAMRSIGVGGHIEPIDQSLFSSDRDMYLEAARREVNEEVKLDTMYREHVVALINDDSTEVGKVHLGDYAHLGRSRAESDETGRAHHAGRLCPHRGNKEEPRRIRNLVADCSRGS
jgi:predicted NUDIX family phosphoesterase